MSPSIPALVDEFKNIIFGMVDFEYPDKSTLVELLPQLVNLDSQSEVNDNFNEFQN